MCLATRSSIVLLGESCSAQWSRSAECWLWFYAPIGDRVSRRFYKHFLAASTALLIERERERGNMQFHPPSSCFGSVKITRINKAYLNSIEN
jgi:hypothetical protein